MLVSGQLIQITIMGNNMQHYRQLGYDVKCKDVIYVPPEQLLPKSTKKVKVQCDVCGKIVDVIYENYNIRKNCDFDLCKSCIDVKRKQTCEEKYGCSYFTQTIEMKEKTKQTNMKKYGVEYVSQTPEIRDKIKQTSIEKNGAESITQSDFFKEKSKQTNMQKYGASHPMQNDEVKQKVLQKFQELFGGNSPMCDVKIREKQQNTCLERYGVANVGASKEIRRRVMETMHKNGTTPTSKPQIQLYNMIQEKYPNAELNYPFSSCSLDVFLCIDNIKIDIEYDGWYWHQDKQADIRRDNFLKSHGFKVLRVRSSVMLPTEQELFDAIDYLVNTEHHFKEIVLSDWKEKEVEECLEQ